MAFGDEPVGAVFEREIGLTGEYKTRKFALDRKAFEQAIANHKATGVDPCIDRGHETWFGDNPGQEAMGWVRELSIRPSVSQPGRDALVAKFELNDLGQRAVDNKHFRYVSMGIDLKGKNRQTGADIGAVLDHVALVKRPFIEGMQPLSLDGDSSPPQETRMKFALKALGLEEEADEASALAAINAHKDFERNILQLSGKATRNEAVGALAALALKAERTDKAEAELVSLKAAQSKAEVDGLIAAAVKDGRVAPAKKDQVVALADKAGIDGLKTFLDMLPKVALTSAESVKEAAIDPSGDLSPAEVKVALALGGAERVEQLRKQKASDRAEKLARGEG